MRDREEMLRDLHRRMDEYESERRMKRAKMAKVAASVTPVCAAAVVGVGLWKGGALTPHNDQLIIIHYIIRESCKITAVLIRRKLTDHSHLLTVFSRLVPEPPEAPYIITTKKEEGCEEHHEDYDCRSSLIILYIISRR